MPDDRTQRPLTQIEVQELSEGTKIKVKWGDNTGFYSCTVKRIGKSVYASLSYGVLGTLDNGIAEVWLV